MYASGTQLMSYRPTSICGAVFLSLQKLSDHRIVIGVSIQHGREYLAMAYHFLYGGDRNILIDETAGTSVSRNVSSDTLGDAKPQTNLLNLLIVISVAWEREEAAEVRLMLMVNLFRTAIEQGKERNVYGRSGLDRNVGQP